MTKKKIKTFMECKLSFQCFFPKKMCASITSLVTINLVSLTMIIIIVIIIIIIIVVVVVVV